MSSVIPWAALLLLGAVAAGSGDPGPPPHSLAQLAARVELDRTALGGGTAPVVISNHNLAEVAAQGVLTTATADPLPAGTEPAPSASSEEKARRERWRAAYHRQRERLTTLQEQLDRLDAEIRAATEAEQSRPPGRARKADRTPLLRQRRDALQRRLEEARHELDRVVRAARAEGAEPGWFR